MKIGFDHEKYIAEQSQYILERVNNYDKLYLEFGGKLISDLHAKRVLPGFDENAKIKLLQTLKDKAEIIICVYAGDIERNKIRGDFGITYDMDVLRLIDDLKGYGLEVNSVVITRYDHQPATTVFIKKLERQNIKVYTHKAIKGYPTDVDAIVSDEGYGINPFIETSKPIVVVTAPGPGSGKLATCLNQLYHEHRLGKSAGYSKFETFPVWNLPLKHPVNIAYEAATVDLKDANMMDYFHYDAYKVPAVNYNRDLEMFPVIRRIIERITGTESVYKSPTDMGVNRIGFGIIDDEVVREAALQEIIRRDFKTECEFKKGQVDYDAVQRMKLIMEDVGLHQEDRIPVVPAREFAAAKTEQNPDHTKEVYAATALALNDGTIITGRTSKIMVSGAAALINAIKHLAGIADEIPLIAPSVLNTIFNLKRNNLHSKHCVLDVEEVLIALSISAVTNPMAQYAIDKLQELNGVQGHTTVMLPHGDEQTFRKLGIDMTCDPQYPSENLSYT